MNTATQIDVYIRSIMDRIEETHILGESEKIRLHDDLKAGAFVKRGQRFGLHTF